MAHLKGMHESGGLHVLRIVGAKAEPGKLTTKLARLDHQRGLLERQLAVWTEKQQVTKRRLGVVEKQMAELGRSVRQLVMPRHTANGRRRINGAAAIAQTDGAVATPSRKEMSLEY